MRPPVAVDPRKDDPLICPLANEFVKLVSSAAPHTNSTMVDSVKTFFQTGGPFMYVNVFWLACAVAVIIERTVTLMFRYNLNAPPFMEQVTKLVLTNNLERAVKLCGAAPNAPLAKVIRAGLTRATRGEIEVAKAVEEAIVTCIIFHLFLTAYSKRMVEVVELNALKLENLLARRNAGEMTSGEFEKKF